MNAPMMNKLQLCGAGEVRCDRSLPARPAAGRPQPNVMRLGVGLGVVAVLVAVLLAGVAAVALIVARAGMAEPLPVIELPRVVIAAKRMLPRTCPVPIDATGSACPVPTDAAAAPTTNLIATSRRTPS